MENINLLIFVVMRKVSYQYTNSGKLLINIPLNGTSKVLYADTVVSPEGDRCIIYDNYIVSLNQRCQNATDVDFYIEKVQQVYDNMVSGISWMDTIKNMVCSHIEKYGRIIDTDLMMMTSALVKVRHVVCGTALTESLELEVLIMAKEYFASYLFITIYNRTPMGFQPSIISALDYFK